jgi:hypothetical protein
MSIISGQLSINQYYLLDLATNKNKKVIEISSDHLWITFFIYYSAISLRSIFLIVRILGYKAFMGAYGYL